MEKVGWSEADGEGGMELNGWRRRGSGMSSPPRYSPDLQP